MGLQQHVITPTHETGNTLDLIITRQCEDLVKETPISDYHISDHWSAICRLNLDKPRITKKTVTFRRIKGVDLRALSDEISSSDLCTNTPDTLSDLVTCYNSTLASSLDRHAPLITKTIPARPLVPWFNDDIKEARKQRRKAERRWRRTGLEADLRVYKATKNNTNSLMRRAKCSSKASSETTVQTRRNCFQQQRDCLEERMKSRILNSVTGLSLPINLATTSFKIST